MALTAGAVAGRRPLPNYLLHCRHLDLVAPESVIFFVSSHLSHPDFVLLDSAVGVREPRLCSVVVLLHRRV